MEQENLSQQKSAQSNAANVSVPDFLLKTYQLLEENKYTSYVSWSKDGTMIIIKKPLAFAEEVLPIFFKHSNLSSFIRQLNNYSFRKMKSKEFEYCFYHEMFRRDRRDLLKFIKRKKVTRPKSHKYSKSSSKKAQAQATNASPDPQEPAPTKKIHTEENNSMKNFQDNQILYLRRANQQLREELMKVQTHDRSLSHVITILSNYYGPENIQTVIKMSDMPKDQMVQEQPNLQNDLMKYNKMFQQPPSNQAFNRSSYDETMTMPQTAPQSFVDYAMDPLGSLGQSENTFQMGNNSAEGVETADNLSVSPRMGDDCMSYKNPMDQPLTEINTKQEPDFFREDSANLSGRFPYTSMNSF